MDTLTVSTPIAYEMDDIGGVIIHKIPFAHADAIQNPTSVMDTLTISDRLSNTGLDRKIAEEQARVLSEIVGGLATKEGLKGVKENMDGFRKDMREDMKGFKEDMREDMKGFKEDMKEDMKGFKEDMREDMKGFREDMRLMGSNLKKGIDKIESSTRWTVGVGLGFITLMIALSTLFT